MRKFLMVVLVGVVVANFGGCAYMDARKDNEANQKSLQEKYKADQKEYKASHPDNSAK
jgi:hypothetical protein